MPTSGKEAKLRHKIAGIVVLGLGVVLLIQYFTFERTGVIRVVGSIGFGVTIVISGLAINAVVRHDGQKSSE
ncbi:hypothetical protein [Clavibacter michiganensis]|uniref:hypothetical protein n=1 Tax=Clavibacter michiganensis TaxID=28447 RepID=UPI002931823E|nr:hypothetical protein [Clavibacter michiganensis]